MSDEINLKRSLDFGVYVLKKNFSFLVGIMVVFWFLTGAQSRIYADLTNNIFLGRGIGGQALLLLIIMLVQCLILITIIKTGLYYLNDETGGQTNKKSLSDTELLAMELIELVTIDIKLSELFTSFNELLIILLNYIVASVIFFLVVVQGLMLLIIPGIYFAIKGIFYMFYIADKDQCFIKALENSYHATNKKELNILFVLFILSALILTLVFICLATFHILPPQLAAILSIVSLSIVIPINLNSLCWIYKHEFIINA